MRNSAQKSALTLIAGLACAVAALALFAWLATEVELGRTLAFDNWGRALVHTWATPALTSTMRFITLFGTPGFMLPLGAAVLWWFIAGGFHRAAWIFAICVTGGFVLDMTLKEFFHRARPEPFFGFPLPESYGFPSGHALFSVCFYGVIAVLAAGPARRRAVRYLAFGLAALLAALIGLSRIYLGVHYPSDVLGGYAAATVWVSSVAAADNWLRRRHQKSRLPSGMPVI